MKIELSIEQRLGLEFEHKNSRDCRKRDRIRCVLLYADGWTAQRIAQSQLIHETTVLRHIKDYQDAEKLMPENGGSEGYLSAEQTAECIAHLEVKRFPTTLSIVAFVAQHYGVTLSVPGMNKWLHRNGFSYKKPVGVPHKFDEAKQAQFIEAYKALKEQSVRHQEPVFFIDAMHPTQSTKLSYGWIRTGERKAVRTTGSRSRMNIVGALNVQNIAGTVIREYDRINGETMSNFFSALRETCPIEQKMHIILDGAGYHRSQQVMASANRLNIELHYLPPYSPNLNPIERLWKVMNEKVRNNRYFADTTTFKDAIRHFFQRILPEMAAELSDRINDNFQRLIPAS